MDECVEFRKDDLFEESRVSLKSKSAGLLSTCKAWHIFLREISYFLLRNNELIISQSEKKKFMRNQPYLFICWQNEIHREYFAGSRK